MKRSMPDRALYIRDNEKRTMKIKRTLYIAARVSASIVYRFEYSRDTPSRTGSLALSSAAARGDKDAKQQRRR